MRFAVVFAIAVIAFALSAPVFASTTCDTKDCKITITINIAFAGATDQQISDWKNDIEGTWNGQSGRTTGDCKCPVIFKVNATKITNASQANCKPPPSGYHCVMVTPWNGTTESLPFFYNSSGQKVYVVGYMGYSTQSPTNGPSIDGWWSNQMNRPAPGGGVYHDAAHEAGHMMGLADKSGGIMNSTTTGPSQQNIDQAVANVCGPNACADRCCCGNGVIDRNKNENCDPKASPDGCTGGAFCCSICCQCHSLSLGLHNFDVKSAPLGIFSNERANVHIGNNVINFITRNNEVVSVGNEALGDQTVNIFMDTETAEAVHDGEISVVAALKHGDIKYEGIGFFSALKFGVVGFFANLFSFAW